MRDTYNIVLRFSPNKLEMLEYLNSQQYFNLSKLKSSSYEFNSIVLAALSHCDLIKWLYDKVTSSSLSSLSSKEIEDYILQLMFSLIECARKGYYESFVFLFARVDHKDRSLHFRPTFGKELINSALLNGNINIADYLYRSNIPKNESINLEDISRSRHSESVRWVINHSDLFKILCSNTTIDGLSYYGCKESDYINVLESIKWVHHNTTFGCTYKAMENAAMNGNLDLLQWLHVNRTEGCTTYAMDSAAGNGHIEVVKWLMKNRSEGCTTDALDMAAKYGHVNVVKWLHENNEVGCTTDAMDGAAKNGHLDIFIWLHNNRTEGCTRNGIEMAIDYKRSEILAYIHENGIDQKLVDIDGYI